MEKLIRQWANKNELYRCHPYSQALKVTEEVGELASALLKGDSMIEVQDAIGDAYITLEVLSMLLETSVKECAEIAYEEIKDRKGIIRNRNFIKDADLGGGHYYDTNGQGD